MSLAVEVESQTSIWHYVSLMAWPVVKTIAYHLPCQFISERLQSVRHFSYYTADILPSPPAKGYIYGKKKQFGNNQGE